MRVNSRLLRQLGHMWGLEPLALARCPAIRITREMTRISQRIARSSRVEGLVATDAATPAPLWLRPMMPFAEQGPRAFLRRNGLAALSNVEADGEKVNRPLERGACSSRNHHPPGALPFGWALQSNRAGFGGRGMGHGARGHCRAEVPTIFVLQRRHQPR